MEQNVSQINRGITRNVAVTVKNIISVKKIMRKWKSNCNGYVNVKMENI